MKAPTRLYLWFLAFLLLARLDPSTALAQGPDAAGATDLSVVPLTSEEKAWLSSHSITLSVDDQYAPMNFRNAEGGMEGLSIDYVRMIERKLGISINLDARPWPEALADALAHRTDGIINANPTPELEKELRFTRHYIEVPMALFTRDEDPVYGSLEELEGERLLVKRKTVEASVLPKRYSSVEIVEVDSYHDALSLLSTGQADGVFGHLIVVNHEIEEHLFVNLKVNYLSYDEIVTKQRIGVRNDSPLLLAVLDKAIRAISNEEHHSIRSRWTDTPLGRDAPTTNLASEEDIEQDDPVVIHDQVMFDQTAYIIKRVAVLFAVLLLVMLVYWLAIGAPRQLNIRLTLLFFAVLFAGLVVAVGVLVLMLLQGGQLQHEVEERKHESIKLAYELKQSSDDLTRFARTFAVTGDPRYEEYFRAIARIRDGKQAHPRGFSNSFWDQVSAGEVELNEAGETYSIEQRMVELGLSEKEMVELKRAKLESDRLIDLEDIAMHAVRGYYKDREGGFTIHGEPDLEMARELLHGEEYHAAKARIMNPISEFFTLLERRTNDELATERARNRAILLVIAVLIAATMVFLVFGFILFQRRLIGPIVKLKDGALRIESGDYSHQISIKSRDEVGDLGRTFDAMARSVDERNQQLRENEAKFRSLVESTQTVPFTFDLIAGHYTYMGSQVEEWLGHPTDSWTDLDSWAQKIHPEDREQAVTACVADSAAGLDHVLEFRMLTAEGRSVWIREVVAVETGDEGPKKLHGFMFDITELKQTLERLKSTQSQLVQSEKLASVGMLAAGVAHEINNPINFMNSSAITLKRKIDDLAAQLNGCRQLLSDDPERRVENSSHLERADSCVHQGTGLPELTANIVDGAKRVTEIVRGLRAFSRVDRSTRESADIHEGLESTLSLLRNRTRDKISLERDYGELPRVDCYPGKLNQVFMNLLVNALDALGQEGSGAGRIIVRTSVEKREDGDWISIAVIDDGPGLSEEALSSLFEPFYTTKPVGQGTGLGLSISHGIVKEHGGSIVATNGPDGGARFTVSLPVHGLPDEKE